jgi:4'-phosphopantetheinyl transferase
LEAHTLTRDDVHIWPITLDVPETDRHALTETLTPDEIQRAARFRFDHHRRAYVVARRTLRAILANYLDAGPGDLRFVYGPHGKPALAAGHSLQFNLSHTLDHALIAITLERAVGIDLEPIRPLPEFDRLAALILPPDERAALQSLPQDEALRLFFRAWTRAEAVVKAHGGGLSLPLAPGLADGWTLRDLDLVPGCAAALAVEGQSPVRVEVIPDNSLRNQTYS